MIKRFYSTLLCVFVVFPAAAQLMVGAKGGIHGGHYFFQDEAFRGQYTQRPRLGATVGGVAHYEVTEVFSLQTEGYYAWRGKDVSNVAEGLNRHRANYHVLEGAALLRVRWGKEPLRFFANVGPGVGYLMGSGGVLEHDALVEYGLEVFKYGAVFSEQELDALTNIYLRDANRWLVSVQAGAGVLFNTGWGHYATVELRYVYGQTFIGPTDGGDLGLLFFPYADNLAASLSGLSIEANYLIPVRLKIEPMKAIRLKN